MKLNQTSLFIVLGFFSSFSVHGARFPNSVEKSFSVTGDAAVAWAKVLMLPLDRGATLGFPLRPNEVTARDLRAGTAVEALSNQVIWNPSVPSMKITGDWLDQTTGSSRDQPHYTFGSAFIPDDLSRGGTWVDLLRSFGFPRKNEPASIFAVLDQRTSGTSKPKLIVTVYRSQSWSRNLKGEWGYQIDIGVDE